MLLLARATGLLVDVALQAVLARLGTRFGPIRLQFVSFGAGAVVTLALLAEGTASISASTQDKAAYVVSHMLIYACYGFCFYNVIGANVSSVRVRIVKELLAQYPAPMPVAVLSARYSASEMLRARLARLESGGQIEALQSRYYLRKRGMGLISVIFAGLAPVLLGTVPRAT